MGFIQRKGDPLMNRIIKYKSENNNWVEINAKEIKRILRKCGLPPNLLEKTYSLKKKGKVK